MPVYGKTTSSGPAGDTQHRIFLFAARVWQALRLFLQKQFSAFQLRTQLEYGDVSVQACISQLSAGFRSGRQNTCVNCKWQFFFIKYMQNLLGIRHICAWSNCNCKGEISRFYPAYVIHYKGKCTPSCDLLVCIFSGSIQGNLYRRRRIILQKVYHVCVKKQSIGKDYSFNPLIPEEEIQFPESRVSEALAAGQSGIHHAGINGLLHKLLLLFCRQTLCPLYLGLVQMNITHFAIQIAQGGKLESAGERNALVPCLEVQKRPHRIITPIIIRTSGIQLRNQLAQFFWLCIGIHCPHPPDRVKGKVFYSICE